MVRKKAARRSRSAAGKAARRFPDAVVAAIDAAKILGLRAGDKHRFIGVWVVVIEKRVFVRSWSVKPDGWFHGFRQDPCGAINITGVELAARAVLTRSDRLKDAIDRAYLEKYDTKGSLRYARDLCSEKSRETTTEFVPR